MLGRPRGRDANRSRLGHFEEAGHDPINQPYLDRSVVSLILSFVPADAQQKSQKGAPNPYLKGTEGLRPGAARVDKLSACRHRPAVRGHNGP